MEDKRNQRGAEVPYLLEPQKAHPTGEFVLWHKMVALHPFVWALGLQLWSVRQ